MGQEPVNPYDPSALEHANYLLAVGDEIYVSSPEKGNAIRKLTDKDGSFTIESGQFAFLLTAEEVTIPFNVIGFISIRASIKFLGLVNISGFHVDPGYSGKLIFAVFNAGPTRIHLRRGDRIFPLWLADLDQQISNHDKFRIGYKEIPSKLVSKISGDFTTAYQLKEQLEKAREDIAALKAFRLYVLAIIGILGLVLFPTIKDRLTQIFSAAEPAAVHEPTPPSKSP